MPSSDYAKIAESLTSAADSKTTAAPIPTPTPTPPTTTPVENKKGEEEEKEDEKNTASPQPGLKSPEDAKKKESKKEPISSGKVEDLLNELDNDMFNNSRKAVGKEIDALLPGTGTLNKPGAAATKTEELKGVVKNEDDEVENPLHRPGL